MVVLENRGTVPIRLAAVGEVWRRVNTSVSYCTFYYTTNTIIVRHTYVHFCFVCYHTSLPTRLIMPYYAVIFLVMP